MSSLNSHSRASHMRSSATSPGSWYPYVWSLAVWKKDLSSISPIILAERAMDSLSTTTEESIALENILWRESFPMADTNWS